MLWNNKHTDATLVLYISQPGINIIPNTHRLSMRVNIIDQVMGTLA